MSDRLYRSRDERMLAGVAGGVSEMLDIDPSPVRIVWALLVVLTGGIALLVYIIMAVVVPEAPDGFAHALGSPAGVSPGEPLPTPHDPMLPAATGWVSPNTLVDRGEGASPGGWRAPDGSVVPLVAAPTPEQAAAGRERRRQRDRSGGLIAGMVLIAIGAFFLLRQFIPAIDPGLWWPVAAIATGAVLVVIAFVPSRRARG